MIVLGFTGLVVLPILPLGFGVLPVLLILGIA